jgi:hypothetical protein
MLSPRHKQNEKKSRNAQKHKKCRKISASLRGTAHFFVHLFFVHFVFLYNLFLYIFFCTFVFNLALRTVFCLFFFFVHFLLIWQFARGDLLYAGTADGATLVQLSGKEISVSVCHELLSVAHEQVTIHISYFTDFIDVTPSLGGHTLCFSYFVCHELLSVAHEQVAEIARVQAQLASTMLDDNEVSTDTEICFSQNCSHFFLSLVWYDHV